jgi:hypothetical protein
MMGGLLYVLLILQVIMVLCDASVTQTSKNTYTVRGAYAEHLKATIYNNQRERTIHSNSNNNNKNNNNSPLPPPPVVRQQDLPIADQKWQSLNPDVEFIPAEGIDPKLFRRFLEQGDEGYYDAEEGTESTHMGMTAKMASIYNIESFAYGGDEYDEYQQAWRLLGFIIDCNPMVDDDYYAGGSGDQGTEDGCARYVLWAAVSDNV